MLVKGMWNEGRGGKGRRGQEMRKRRLKGEGDKSEEGEGRKEGRAEKRGERGGVTPGKVQLLPLLCGMVFGNPELPWSFA